MNIYELCSWGYTGDTEHLLTHENIYSEEEFQSIVTKALVEVLRQRINDKRKEDPKFFDNVLDRFEFLICFYELLDPIRDYLINNKEFSLITLRASGGYYENLLPLESTEPELARAIEEELGLVIRRKGRGE